MKVFDIVIVMWNDMPPQRGVVVDVNKSGDCDVLFDDGCLRNAEVDQIIAVVGKFTFDGISICDAFKEYRCN